MHANPAPFFDPDGGMPCANIFHRDHPGMVVLEIRGDFAVDYAREIIARSNEPSAPAWIPCSERMPEPDVQVLFYAPGSYGAEHGGWTGFKWLARRGGCRWEPAEVSHWMPLPEEPKA